MRPLSSVMPLEGVGIERTIADEEMGIGRKGNGVPEESLMRWGMFQNEKRGNFL